MKTYTKNWVKQPFLDFYRKFLLYPKWGKWVIFGTKINTFERFTNYRIFRKFYLMASTKSGSKWLLKVLLKIFIMSKNGVNDAFRGRKINIFEVFIKSVLYIFLKLHQMTGINNWVKVIFFRFWRKIFILLKVG